MLACSAAGVAALEGPPEREKLFCMRVIRAHASHETLIY